MGFLKELAGGFTGSNAKKELEKANAQATGEVNAGEEKAANALTQGRTALQRGYEESSPYLTQSYNAATGRYDQKNLAGNTQAQKLYLDAIGANGPEAQAAAAQGFESSDPFLTYNRDKAWASSRAKAAATGDSGNAHIAAQRAMQDVGSEAWNKMLDRQRDAGAQGYQVAGQLAGLDTGYGKDMAGLRTGLGQGENESYGNEANLRWGAATTRAGNTINFGNAMAENRNALTNNLLKVGQIGANAAAAAIGGKKPA